MSSLLANKVVIGMNWSGQCGKKAFGSLKLAQVVTGMPRFSHLQYFFVIILSYDDYYAECANFPERWHGVSHVTSAARSFEQQCLAVLASTKPTRIVLVGTVSALRVCNCSNCFW